MLNTELYGLAIIVIGVLEAVKRSNKVPTNYIPAVAVGGGAVIGAIFGLATSDILSGIINGITIGLVSTGIYDVVAKKIIGTIKR